MSILIYDGAVVSCVSVKLTTASTRILEAGILFVGTNTLQRGVPSNSAKSKD